MSVLRKLPVVFATAALAATACTENLESGRACPALCPIEEVGIRDTIFTSAIVLDATLERYPLLGAAIYVPLINRTEMDVRGVFRFDELPEKFVPGSANADSLIRSVSGATLLIRPSQDSSSRFPLPTDSVTFVAYEVDTTATDTLVEPVAALFGRSDRFLGRVRVRAGAVHDTAHVAIPIDDSVVTAKLRAKARLRIGVMVESPLNAAIAIQSTNGFAGPSLRFRPSRDTVPVAADSLTIAVGLASLTPLGHPDLQPNLADYELIVKGNPFPSTGVEAAGGIPGRRVYLRFLGGTGGSTVEAERRFAYILDSTQIIRATLRFTQLPSPGALASDTARVNFDLGTATARVVDLRTAVQLTTPVGVPQLVVASRDSGLRAVEVAPVLRVWSRVNPAERPRALVIQVPTAGFKPAELRFWSSEAAANLRPTLQITYVPRTAAGIP